MLSFILFVLFVLNPYTSGCLIQGQDSGTCAPAQRMKDILPFCGTAIAYSPCVPRYNAAYPNITVIAKDNWVRETFHNTVNRRARIERGDKPADMARWEGGKKVKRRFNGNDECQNAFKNYLCWMNFPRCDQAGESLPLCRSACENFFKTCKYPKSMWRCYDPAHYGAKAPELDAQLDIKGVPIYLRAAWPGLPFVTNRFAADDETELPVCTPAMKNGVSAHTVHIVAVLLALLSTVALWIQR